MTFAFENVMPNPNAYSVSAVTDPRYLSVTGRHIFVKMPDDRFEPRVNDHRIGYFVNKSTDLTSYDNFPNFALINKWRLIKKILMLKCQNLKNQLFSGLKILHQKK